LKARRSELILKSKREIDLMRVSASTVSEILDELELMVVPGVTTFDLDAAAEAKCRERGVTPAFKGLYGFPACLCVAVNEEVVHGIPSKKRVLRDGDIIGLDFGVVYKGWYGDHARTVTVGNVDAASKKLIAVTRACLERAVAACGSGVRLHEIGRKVEECAVEHGFGVVRDFVGHGVGRRLHEDPQVPNYFDAHDRQVLKSGMVLCIEPMINAGTHEVRMLADDWTAVTGDGMRSAHFEHTIAITDDGPEILSRSGFGAAKAASG
jgi:methionyl aminopeptidase